MLIKLQFFALLCCFATENTNQVSKYFSKTVHHGKEQGVICENKCNKTHHLMDRKNNNFLYHIYEMKDDNTIWIFFTLKLKCTDNF